MTTTDHEQTTDERSAAPDPSEIGEPIGLMHTWWRGDFLPELPDVDGLTIAQAPETEIAELSPLTDLNDAELQSRVAAGHRLWLARIGREPAGYGWLATREAAIEPLGLTLSLGAEDRYLWDFVTLPDWRGRGIYPRLIQAMVRADTGATRFWIGHDVPNVASRRGIAKTGFALTTTLVQTSTGDRLLVPAGSITRAEASAILLGVPLMAE